MSKAYLRDEIIALYKELKTITAVAEKLKIDRGTVSKILKTNNIAVRTNGYIAKERSGIQILQYKKDGTYIATYNSSVEASSAVGKSNSKSNGAASHITDACKGKRKSAYGYIWKFKDAA